MSRYLVPAAFLAASLWVGWYNRTHGASKILVPLIDTVFPSASPQELGDRSAEFLVAATVLVTALTIAEHIRDVRRAKQPQD